VNDDLVIFSVFLSLTVIAVNAFSMLTNLFAEIRNKEQETLKLTSSKLTESLRKSDLQLSLIQHIPLNI
jgi:hypothetical protein